MANVKWYGPSCVAQVDKMVNDRLKVAGLTLRDHLRKAVSVAASAGRTRGKPRLNQPSKPGEYPRKRTGHLRRNIQMESDSKLKVVRVGTNVIYGRFLELGTRTMARRPWMTLGISETLPRIRQIMRSPQ